MTLPDFLTAVKVEGNSALEWRYVPEPPPVQYFRVPHDLERYNYDAGDRRYGGDGYRVGKIRGSTPTPEVYRVYQDQTTPIGEAHQWLWRNLNPKLSKDRWSKLLGNNYAYTNRTGFGDPDHPRRDYVNQRNLDKDANGNWIYELPRFHACLVNGGAILEGKESSGRVYINSILLSDPVPTAEAVLAHTGLWFYGTSVGTDGKVTYMQKLGTDWQYHNIVLPLLTKYPIWLPANELHKLPTGFFPPDARWMA